MKSEKAPVPRKKNTWESIGHLDVPLEVRINGDRINGLFHLLINGLYSYNLLIKLGILGL